MKYAKLVLRDVLVTAGKEGGAMEMLADAFTSVVFDPAHQHLVKPLAESARAVRSRDPYRFERLAVLKTRVPIQKLVSLAYPHNALVPPPPQITPEAPVLASEQEIDQITVSDMVGWLKERVGGEPAER